MAEQYFPGEDPVGKRLGIDVGNDDEGWVMSEIIGVVARMRFHAVDEMAPLPVIYCSLGQARRTSLTLFLRSTMGSAALEHSIRDAIASIDPSLPVFDARRMMDRVQESWGSQRLLTFLFSVFAGLALVLATIGLYGLLAYTTLKRVREIGIRLALGARPDQIRTLILSHGLQLLLIGSVIGRGSGLCPVARTAKRAFRCQRTRPKNLSWGRRASLRSDLLCLLDSGAPRVTCRSDRRSANTNDMNDLKFACRQLRKSPGFTLVAILTLALGIGLNTAIFSVVNAVLLKPPLYKNPEELVWIWATRKNVPRAFYSIPNFNDTRAQSQTINSWIAFSTWGANLLGPSETERLQGIKISSGALQDLGVVAATGRILMTNDEKPDSARVVMLSYGVWQRRFGGDPRIIGSTQILNGDTYTVIGVLPRGTIIPNAEVDVIAPLNLETDERRTERGTNFLRLMARLKPGFTPQQAQAELAAITDRLREQFPTDNGNLAAPRVLKLQDEIVGEYKQMLGIIFGAVIAVLMIACLNLANLQLARASARQHELAIRSALGASRWQILRQLLSEGALLALAGGLIGLLLASWGKDLLVWFAPSDFPHARDISVDPSVIGFCIGISVFAALAVNLVPAFRAASADANKDLKSSSP